MKNKSIKEIREIILPVLKRHKAKRAGLFGSIARGELSKDSDIDILVEIDDDISLLDFVGIKLELEEALGHKVDLVEYSTIKPRIRDRILNEQIQIIWNEIREFMWWEHNVLKSWTVGSYYLKTEQIIFTFSVHYNNEKRLDIKQFRYNNEISTSEND